MNRKEAMIKGYEIAKTTEINGELKLATEVSKISESVNLCESCTYGGSACIAMTEGLSPTQTYFNVGMSSYVTGCTEYKEK